MRTTDERPRGDEIQSRPGNSGFPESISASTHPTLQTSIARVYSLNVNITSGARYHLHPRQQAREHARCIDTPRCHIFGHERTAVIRDVRWRLGRSCEPEITELSVRRLHERNEISGRHGNDRQHPPTLRSQLELSRRFEGFRSLWMTSAEYNAFSALKVWGRQYADLWRQIH